MSDTKEQIEAELNSWRTKLDTLRVRASLLKLEYRDKPDEIQAKLESAYAAAKVKFTELKTASGEQATNLKLGFSAALSAFKDAYKGHTEDDTETTTDAG